MKRNKLLIGALFLGAAGAGVLGTASFWAGESIPSLPQYNSGKEVFVVESEGYIRALLSAEGQAYEARVPPGSTVYDLMNIVAGQSAFRFRRENFGELGFFIEEINGVAQNPKEGMYWIYYINGQKATVGVSNYKVQANDVIEWKYEEEQ